ncbi:MAG TPA: glycosyltransferase family 1 protein, partial [Sedimenticola sp.]|nr:glycosyltransferase family 1 protein [Sedimenticola sp.]
MQLRLLFVVTEDWYFVSHRLPLAVAAREAGFEVAVATRPGEDRERIEAAGIRFLPLEIDRRGMNPFKETISVVRLARLMRRERPDLVHLVALKPVLLGNLAARLSGVKRRVSAVAGMGFLFTGEKRGGMLAPAVRRLLGQALRGSRVIVQNPDDARLLRESLGVPAEDLRLIRGAGVDLEKFQPRPEPSGVPLVMLPSRLLWDKGVGEFVEAARRLLASGVQARFVLVGAPDPANPASVHHANLDQWQEEGVIEWWGHQKEMATVLAQAHLVCLPSYREGLPKVLIEAVASGRAVVTCNVPGCREVVAQGETGLLVPAQDAAALADAIRTLLEDPAWRRRLGEAGRA